MDKKKWRSGYAIAVASSSEGAGRVKDVDEPALQLSVPSQSFVNLASELVVGLLQVVQLLHELLLADPR
eukprot:6202675-Pleurochrysis_carterae.AAC.1